MQVPSLAAIKSPARDPHSFAWPRLRFSPYKTNLPYSKQILRHDPLSFGLALRFHPLSTQSKASKAIPALRSHFPFYGRLRFHSRKVPVLGKQNLARIHFHLASPYLSPRQPVLQQESSHLRSKLSFASPYASPIQYSPALQPKQIPGQHPLSFGLALRFHPYEYLALRQHQFPAQDPLSFAILPSSPYNKQIPGTRSTSIWPPYASPISTPVFGSVKLRHEIHFRCPRSLRFHLVQIAQSYSTNPRQRIHFHLASPLLSPIIVPSLTAIKSRHEIHFWLALRFHPYKYQSYSKTSRHEIHFHLASPYAFTCTSTVLQQAKPVARDPLSFVPRLTLSRQVPSLTASNPRHEIPFIWPRLTLSPVQVPSLKQQISARDPLSARPRLFTVKYPVLRMRPCTRSTFIWPRLRFHPYSTQSYRQASRKRSTFRFGLALRFHPYKYPVLQQQSPARDPLSLASPYSFTRISTQSCKQTSGTRSTFIWPRLQLSPT
ncbi:hypothetical protein AVEN_171752-1 [Araneus ventricosus]|uniref:Uncharacterized protein n=1 Tax=Araneus ventricosus TaxID=182803 RepID=A0A4Y2B3T0_ARAVE|nr:hypothetical protein AVEN_171752-1 [Araneus ventricosus]